MTTLVTTPATTPAATVATTTRPISRRRARRHCDSPYTAAIVNADSPTTRHSSGFARSALGVAHRAQAARRGRGGAGIAGHVGGLLDVRRERADRTGCNATTPAAFATVRGCRRAHRTP